MKLRLKLIPLLVAACMLLLVSCSRDSQPTPGIQATVTGEVLFNPDEYDVQCIDETLGMGPSDELVHMGRVPTDGELVLIERCLVEAVVVPSTVVSPKSEARRPAIVMTPDTQATVRHHRPLDLGRYDRQCMDETLSMSIFDQLVHMGRAPTDDERALIEHCQNTTATQDPQDPSAPVRRIVPRPALPDGVIAVDLKRVQLPNATQIDPTTDGCEVYEGSYCAEVRWEAVSDLRAGAFTAIEISPSNPDVIYAGVDSNDMSLYRSEDGGETWRLTHISGHTSGVAISPDDPNLLVYSILEGPMQRTTDGGLTWSSVNTGDVRVQRLDPANVGANLFTTVVFAPDNGDIVYAATVSGMHRSGSDRGPVDIYISRNGGADWTKAGTCETCGGAKTMTVDPGDSDVVWAATNNGVQVSRDGGKVWSGNLIEQYTNRPESYGVALQPGNPDTILVASAESGMFRSTDGGQTWTKANTGLSTRYLHQVTFAPSEPSVSYVATHQGVYRSDDAGETWYPRSQGLQYKFVTPIAVHPQNADVVFVGSSEEVYTTHPGHFNPGLHEGEGLYKSTDGGQNWFLSDSGIDEAKLAQMGTHPLLPFYLWANGESGRGAFFTPDAGETWLFTPNHAAHYPMVFAFSRSFPTVIYLTSWMNDGELMTSTDGGYNWPDLTPRVAAGISEETKSLGLYDDTKRRWLHLHGLAIAETDPNIIYVGSVHDTVYPDVDFNLKGSHIFKSEDGGMTFMEMSNGFPIETRTSINAIVIHPTDPNIVYAMTSLHESETAIGIYKTEDGAKTWSPVNNGLDLYTNDLQMDRTSPDTLYAASESGIYKSTNGGKSWRRSSEGIPDETPVIDLAIDPLNTLVLYAITPDHVYRTKNGGNDWYPIDLGLPLLPQQQVDSAQAQLMSLLQLDREQTGHSVYGSTFAQDRTLEIDATGRILYVVVKTKAGDMYGPEWGKVRKLYRAVLSPLEPIRYEFDLQGQSISIESTSHVYDMVYDRNSEEFRLMAAGPRDTIGQTTVTVPDQYLAQPFRVQVDGIDVPFTSDAESINFEYVHNGRSALTISGK